AVLSGSSATKMTAKIETKSRAAAMARQYGAISRHAPKQTGPRHGAGAGRCSLADPGDAAHRTDPACPGAGPPEHRHAEGGRPPVHPLAAGDQVGGRPLPRPGPPRSGGRHSPVGEEPGADPEEAEGG